MTKKSSRPGQQVGVLKALLLTGGVIASLAGTRLLAQQDLVMETDVMAHEPLTIVVPTQDASPIPKVFRSTEIRHIGYIHDTDDKFIINRNSLTQAV